MKGIRIIRHQILRMQKMILNLRIMFQVQMIPRHAKLVEKSLKKLGMVIKKCGS